MIYECNWIHETNDHLVCDQEKNNNCTVIQDWPHELVVPYGHGGCRRCHSHDLIHGQAVYTSVFIVSASGLTFCSVLDDRIVRYH
jgi:hypothetical protein